MKHLIYMILGLTLMTTLNAIERRIKHPEWSRNVTIYEANIRQFSKEGTFSEFEKYLPELQKMGVKIVWLMPIHPIGELNRKGSLGSYYSVKDYTDVNPEFGTKDDFRRLVEKTHELGMYLIIDWVANHTAWDNVWTKTNIEYFDRDSAGNHITEVKDWTDVIDLNYDNPNLRQAMIKALKFWVEEFDIDGYR
ncbi:MAG: alpha-amylase family glycosyl hydrolase, partial [bacterium]